MIYFDNSSTTLFKPESVLKSAIYGQSIAANAGRSAHKKAMQAAMMIYQARKAVGEMVNNPYTDGIFFGFNCTDVLNAVILGSATPTGHIVTTALEHNSVLRPINALSKDMINYDVVCPARDGLIKAADIERAIKPDTYMIIVNHVSNVTGAIAPLYEIGKIAKAHKIKFVVDCAQSAGYLPIDQTACNIDALCFSPHKGLHGLQGLGVASVAENFDLKPIRFGGTGTDSQSTIQPTSMPEGFECGTLPVANIFSLIAAIKHNQTQDFDRLKAMGERLRSLLMDNARVIMYTPSKSLGSIVTFNLSNMSPTACGDLLNSKFDIAVRCGLHCAPIAHRVIGTGATGAIRCSLSYENTDSEVDEFVKAIDYLSKTVNFS